MAKRFILRWRVGYTVMVQKAIVIVSDEDAWRLRNRHYYVEYKDGVPAEVSHNTGSGKYLLAREIMNAQEDELVLRLNFDALDCRRSNLKVIKREARRVRRNYRKRVSNKQPEE